MRIWAGRWDEVDEALMIAWFANAIMRGWDDGRAALLKEPESAQESGVSEPCQHEPGDPQNKDGSIQTCQKCGEPVAMDLFWGRMEDARQARRMETFERVQRAVSEHRATAGTCGASEPIDFAIPDYVPEDTLGPPNWSERGDPINWTDADNWAKEPIPEEESTEWQSSIVENAARAYRALRAENERLKAGRVTCGCGADTASITKAQCYSCRQKVYHDLEETKTERDEARGELAQLRESSERTIARLCKERKADAVDIGQLNSALADAQREVRHRIKAYEELEARLAKVTEERESGNRAFVEMNAVFEAVMRAIRGEALSEFDQSHGAVYAAKKLREERDAAVGAIEQALGFVRAEDVKECIVTWHESRAEKEGD